MFLPFLPFILALAALTALISAPDPPPAELGGGQVFLVWLGLLVIGALLGRLPNAGKDGQASMRFGPRRVAMMAIWLLTITGLNLYPELRAQLTALWSSETFTSEGALALLLINYWLADGLALRAPRVREGTAGLRRWVRGLRIPLPVVVLFLLSMLVLRGVEALFLAAGQQPLLGWQLQSLQLIIGLGLFAGAMLVAVPGLIRICWGFQRLDLPAVEQVILAELAAHGIRRTPVFLWPEEALGATTASVIGLVPPFRYLLIGRRLATTLTADEIRSVTAHEAAHIRQRHLWYYLAAILAFILALQLVLETVLVGSFLIGWGFPPWLGVGLEVAALLFFLRFGIGFLSRHFERQADGTAYRSHGVAAFAGALSKVGGLNHISPETDNWHHYGIQRRIGYLQQAAQDPHQLAQHDRRVGQIKRIVLGALVLGVVAQPLLAGGRWLPLFAEHWVAERVDTITVPTPAQWESTRFLAAEAYREGDLVQAEHYFRTLLRWRSEDPQAQNNLAWLLVTQPQPSQDDLREGLRLAEQASDQEQAAYIWDTLAEAYFQLDQFQKAEAAADRALRLAEAGQKPGSAPVSYYQERWEGFTAWPRN